MRAKLLVAFMVVSFPICAKDRPGLAKETTSEAVVNAGKQRRLLQLTQLYELGQEAMDHGHYQKALDYFGRLMTPGSLELISDVGRAELAERRGAALLQLGKPRQALAEMEGLVWDQLPPSLFLRLQLVRARALNEGEAPIAAYELLRDLDRTIERYEWQPEDRKLVVQVTEKVNAYYSELLKLAGRNFEGGSYEEAVTGYEELVQAIERQVYPAMLEPGSELTATKIYYRLGQAYFMAGDLPHCISALKRIPWQELGSSDRVAELHRNACFLQGLAERKDRRYEAAISTLKRYLSMGQSAPLEKRLEANWELGLAHYEQGEMTLARIYFEKHLSLAPPKSRPARLAALYLSRIQLAQGEYEALLKYLGPVAGGFEESDPLRFEANYLLGEAYYYHKNYGQAIAAFEASLPSRNLRKAEWAPRSLYNLGWSYLKQAEMSEESSPKQRASQLSAAEKAFQVYLTVAPEDKAYLALAQVYLTRGRVLGQSAAFEQVESLLGHEGTLNQPAQVAAGLLLRAEAAQTYAAKEAHYARLCSEEFRGYPSQVTGFYYRGLNHLAEARRLASGSDIEESQALLFRAVGSLTVAGKHLRKALPQMAALALKYSAEALFLIGNTEQLQHGLAVCESLVTEDVELLEALAEPDELWYLRGLFASRLMTQDEEAMRKRAEESLHQVITRYPQGNYAAVSYKLLATLHYQAGEYEAAEPLFLALAHNFPNSGLAADAWFWASECAEWLRRDQETVRSYRKQVFESYPDSTHAAEAYYAYYRRSDYLRGLPEAVAHLSMLPKRFPKSPRCILAHYLLGVNSRQDARFADAVEHFELAEQSFHDAMQGQVIQAKDLEYYTSIYYRTRLELGKSHLDVVQRSGGARQQVHLEYARSAFSGIIEDFATASHRYASQLVPSNEYKRLLEEAQLGLARGLRAAGDQLAAASVLDSLISQGIGDPDKSSYVRSQSFYQRGVLFAESGDHLKAIALFDQAEEAAGGQLLSTEELLQLWLDKAQAQLALTQHAQAMRLLSQIINYDSDSTLRVHAMYLRAVVYEEQGKRDMALRQLRSTATKSGIWATQAQRKLDTDYGFN